MYESKDEPLLSSKAFAARLARHVASSLGLVFGSLTLGAVGYHFTEGIPWLDAVLNAAMILTGMGPVSQLHTVCGKLFATGYALFSGVAFLAIAGLLIAPIGHRILHKLHLEEEDDSSS